MREFFTVAEMIDAACPDLPANERGIRRMAEKEGWRRLTDRSRKIGARGGGWEYHISLLPKSAQARLRTVFGDDTPDNSNIESAPPAPEKSDQWLAYDRLSAKEKRLCQERLDLLDAVDEHQRANGSNRTSAIVAIGAKNGVGRRTITRYFQTVAGLDRSEWLPALRPSSRSAKERAEVSDECWETILSDYMRPEAPSFAACVRRASDKAAENGWTMPTERSLRRRLDVEVDPLVLLLARKGKKAAAQALPAQRRTVAGLHAMQAVNMDGHKFDVFVKWPDGRITRPIAVALQDLYSRKIVAMRISDSENVETTRLAIGDMVTRYGIPDLLTTDNGTAFSSKWITGRNETRYRYKIKHEEPQGLLKTLGIETHFAKVAHGQAKPIERAFRDFCDTVARHPKCAGAYTGNHIDNKPENYGRTALPIAEFKALVAQEVEAHNARDGRRTEMAKGRSFDAVFQESLEKPSTIVRWATEAQRAVWLLAAESVRAQPGTGELHFYDNRYWSMELNAHAGEKLIVRFDPENLHGSVRVYDTDERFICNAPCIADTGFYDKTKARERARDEKALMKALKEEQRLTAKIPAEALGRFYGPKADADEPTAPSIPDHPKVKRLATAALPKGQSKPADQEIDDAAFEENVSRGLRIISGGRG